MHRKYKRTVNKDNKQTFIKPLKIAVLSVIARPQTKFPALTKICKLNFRCYIMRA
jgi:hypothetical protein